MSLVVFLMRFVFVGSIVWPVWVSPTSLSEVVCGKSWLKQKSCRLKLGNQRIHMTKDRLVVVSPGQRWVHELPFIGKQHSWHKLGLKSGKGQPFVEWYVWGDPEGEAQVRSLYWIVVNPFQQESKILLKEVVQHKRQHLKNPSIRKPASSKDAMTRHGLFWKGDLLAWRVGYRQGLLELAPNTKHH